MLIDLLLDIFGKDIFDYIFGIINPYPNTNTWILNYNYEFFNLIVDKEL